MTWNNVGVYDFVDGARFVETRREAECIWLRVGKKA